jgi:ketosteroid isomerase-like protein
VSKANIELIRRIHEADAQQDYERALSFFDADVELDATHMPDGQIFRGLDEVSGHISDWRAGWSDFREDVEDLFDAGDRVVIFFCDRGIGRASGVATEIRYASVWEIRDSRVKRIKNFLDREEALRYVDCNREGHGSPPLSHRAICSSAYLAMPAS